MTVRANAWFGTTEGTNTPNPRAARKPLFIWYNRPNTEYLLVDSYGVSEQVYGEVERYNSEIFYSGWWLLRQAANPGGLYDGTGTGWSAMVKAESPTNPFFYNSPTGGLKSNNFNIFCYATETSPAGFPYYAKMCYVWDNLFTSAESFEIYWHTDDPAIFYIGNSIEKSYGDKVCVYHGEYPSTMGGNYQQIAFSRQVASSNTWTNGVVLASTGGKNDNFYAPGAILNSNTNNVVVFWVRDTDNRLYFREISNTYTLGATTWSIPMPAAMQTNYCPDGIYFKRNGVDKYSIITKYASGDTCNVITINANPLTNATVDYKLYTNIANASNGYAITITKDRYDAANTRYITFHTANDNTMRIDWDSGSTISFTEFANGTNIFANNLYETTESFVLSYDNENYYLGIIGKSYNQAAINNGDNFIDTVYLEYFLYTTASATVPYRDRAHVYWFS